MNETLGIIQCMPRALEDTEVASLSFPSWMKVATPFKKGACQLIRSY